MHFYSGTTNAIDNTIVRDNRIERFGSSPNCTSAMIFSHGNNQKAYNNIITGQGGPCGTGIQLDYGANAPKVYNNTIYGNNSSGVSIGSASSLAVVKNNIVFFTNHKKTNIAYNSFGTFFKKKCKHISKFLYN